MTVDYVEAKDYIARLDAEAAQESIPFAAGRLMRWRVFGRGDPLVLIHGGHGSWLHWIRNIEALAANRSIIAADLPGFGDSDAMPHGSGVQYIVEGVIASMNALLGDRQAVDLAGFSFGGSIAARVAAQRGAIRRLALLGSAGSGTPPRAHASLVRWQQLEGPAQEAALRHNMLAQMLHDDASADALALEAYARSARAATYRSRGEIQLVKLPQILAHYEEPVLFLWGEHDVTGTPEHARNRLLAGRSNRVFKQIPGAGHWIQCEAPDLVNRELDGWFAAG